MVTIFKFIIDTSQEVFFYKKKLKESKREGLEDIKQSLPLPFFLCQFWSETKLSIEYILHFRV